MKMDWSCSANGVATLKCVPILLADIIWWLLSFAGAAAILFIIISGYKYIISHGDAKKIDEARRTLVYSMLGLAIIFLSFFIVNLITGITGTGCLDLSKPLSFSACK